MQEIPIDDQTIRKCIGNLQDCTEKRTLQTQNEVVIFLKSTRKRFSKLRLVKER